MGYEFWTETDKQALRNAIADGAMLPDILAMFPDRPKGAIKSKIRYERHRKFILGQRSRLGDVAVDATDMMDARLSNEDQDAKFQAALKAALRAGLEKMPKPARIDYAEFRPAPFFPAPRVSYGGSPAALCAHLGAR